MFTNNCKDILTKETHVQQQTKESLVFSQFDQDGNLYTVNIKGELQRYSTQPCGGSGKCVSNIALFPSAYQEEVTCGELAFINVKGRYSTDKFIFVLGTSKGNVYIGCVDPSTTHVVTHKICTSSPTTDQKSTKKNTGIEHAVFGKNTQVWDHNTLLATHQYKFCTRNEIEIGSICFQLEFSSSSQNEVKIIPLKSTLRFDLDYKAIFENQENAKLFTQIKLHFLKQENQIVVCGYNEIVKLDLKTTKTNKSSSNLVRYVYTNGRNTKMPIKQFDVDETRGIVAVLYAVNTVVYFHLNNTEKPYVEEKLSDDFTNVFILKNFMTSIEYKQKKQHKLRAEKRQEANLIKDASARKQLIQELDSEGLAANRQKFSIQNLMQARILVRIFEQRFLFAKIGDRDTRMLLLDSPMAKIFFAEGKNQIFLGNHILEFVYITGRPLQNFSSLGESAKLSQFDLLDCIFVLQQFLDKYRNGNLPNLTKSEIINIKEKHMNMFQCVSPSEDTNIDKNKLELYKQLIFYDLNTVLSEMETEQQETEQFEEVTTTEESVLLPETEEDKPNETDVDTNNDSDFTFALPDVNDEIIFDDLELAYEESEKNFAKYGRRKHIIEYNEAHPCSKKVDTLNTFQSLGTSKAPGEELLEIEESIIKTVTQDVDNVETLISRVLSPRNTKCKSKGKRGAQMQSFLTREYPVHTASLASSAKVLHTYLDTLTQCSTWLDNVSFTDVQSLRSRIDGLVAKILAELVE